MTLASKFLGTAILTASLQCNITGPAQAQSEPIPLDQLGAAATRQVRDDSLSVTATESGARLRCAFQRLEGEATSHGLWLRSTTNGPGTDRVRLVAVAVGRESGDRQTLSRKGEVTLADPRVQFIRPGLIEEYSVSVDGVRQDFVLGERPAGSGDLRVDLALSGARAEQAPFGTALKLNASGRELAYSRLRVTDATGRELLARLDVPAANRLAVCVEDDGAVYPVRIDPTFSDASWVSVGPAGMPGADGGVSCVLVDDNGVIYVGGAFTFIGTVPANRVARWDGVSWSALGSGIGTGTYDAVSALAMVGTNLYAGGSFTTTSGARNLAKWDGSAWVELAEGAPANTVTDMATIGTDLYFTGVFADVNEVPGTRGIAKWDGTNWLGLGSGLAGGQSGGRADTLLVVGTDLYVGGNFTDAGGVAATNVAKWSGSNWSALGGGLAHPYSDYRHVYALAAIGSDIYAGGYFEWAWGEQRRVHNIARWDGSQWWPLSSGVEGIVMALAADGNDLIAGGDFTSAGGVPANNLARWNGSTWSEFEGGANQQVSALTMHSGRLYVGGGFTAVGDTSALGLASWDGAGWSAFGAGINNHVNVLAWGDTGLIMGGKFTSAGNIVANHIAQWNGATWSTFGSGITSYGYAEVSVNALAVSGTNIYVGGQFMIAGGIDATNIAKWNGREWSSLGYYAPAGATIEAVLVDGSDVYVGGNFRSVLGAPGDYIAKWDGTNWTALGAGLNKTVHALAKLGNDIYAGGEFTTAGGQPANYIAKWDGANWAAVGDPAHIRYYSVNALVANGQDLYVGGSFPALQNIQKWDGNAWSSLGTGLNNGVTALAFSGPNLYAVGAFTQAGSTPANRVAKWDGQSWSALGSGVDNYATAVTADNLEHLFVGGWFYQAGTNYIPYLAQANLDGSVPATPLVILTDDGHLGFINGVFGFNLQGMPGRPVVVEASTNLTNWVPLETNIFGAGPLHFSDPDSGGHERRWYRAVSP